MVSGWEISLVLFLIVEFFFFFILIWQTIASLPLKWCRQLKNNKKGNCEAFLDKRVVAEKELLIWLGPKIQKQYT